MRQNAKSGDYDYDHDPDWEQLEGMEEFRINVATLVPDVCAFCKRPAEGNYSVHRDGFCDGPEVQLCNGCGDADEPSLETIWERISHVRNPELASDVS